MPAGHYPSNTVDSMHTADLRRGVRDVAPLLLGIAPFGLVVGVAAANAGLDLELAIGMSVLVFAGAAQLAALELLRTDAPLVVVISTAAIINLRMLMYSASIAPHFRDLGARLKGGLAYVLTDQAYALSIARFENGPDVDRVSYYVGVAMPIWLVWQVMTVAGALLGAGVPDSWGLDFTVPLVFLALLVPAVEDSATMAAAFVGGSVAVIGAGLPLNLGLPVGATIGVLAGATFETVKQ
ncbi:AzlC family protein [Halodesulfurarchaeum formicicum]|uniref:AzlC family protein n=2 Tax=Halodesulfurarchaeum formicicum TaxID=1873524 RepID=A0A1J1AAT6_9EURY|nr:AzlC family protein [Halodesulfurarchaeum formicicum]